MSFRLKTVLGIAVLEIIFLSILIVSGLHYLRVSNEQQLMERSSTTAKLVATMTSKAVVAMDIATIDDLLDQTVNNPGIDFARVRLANGVVLSEAGNPTALRAQFVQDTTIASADRDGRLDVRHAIKVGGNHYGSIELGFNVGALESIRRDASRWMLFVASIEIILVGIFGLIVGSLFTRQLVELKKGAQKLADGDLGHTICTRGNDELSETAKSFNQMSQSLAKYVRELKTAKDTAGDDQKRTESLLIDGIQSLSQGVLITNADGTIALQNTALHGLYPEVKSLLSSIGTLKAFQELIEPFVDHWRIDEKGQPTAQAEKN